MNLGEKIKLLRAERDILQGELAARLGVSQAAVSAWEKGVRNPNAEQRRKICDFFNISEAELFGAPACVREPPAAYLNPNVAALLDNPKILEALSDPVAVQALLTVHASNNDLKAAIRDFIECAQNISEPKRRAILELCK